jgi:TatA/E family protein of Tat protein translocase
MGPLGTGEIVFIFVLALLLFGPKELPKIGRTIGKAMTEFRRAQTELKATFDREMVNLERESGIRELVETSYQPDSYNYDYSSHDNYYDGSYESTVTNTTTTDASASLGAGSSAPLQIEAAAGSIASGHLETGHVEHHPATEVSSNGHSAGHDAASHEAAPVATDKPVNS